MKTIQLFILSITALSLSACNFDLNIGQTNGNGNVTTETRNIEHDFTKVKGCCGLDIYLTQGDENKVVVEADENLQEQIETYVDNDRLVMRVEGNIGRSKAKKVYVTYKSIDEVDASSGSDMIFNSVLKAETISLECSSGADIEVEVFAKEVLADCSSGADIEVSGKATSLRADASSGSDIVAKDLLVVDCRADASSGGDITVNVKDKLVTEASSGGTINYYGNPSEISKNKSRSGSVRKL